jgi:hypothetical protein
MKLEETARELLQRYLRAAGKSLPLKKRFEITKEIESMILDICEERFNDAGINEKQMEDILLELGKPSGLAAKYKDEKPLIGSELMPIFKLVLFIVCLITSIISIISFSFNVSGMSASEISLYFVELFSSLTGTVGTIFIIFLILERVIKNKTEINFAEQNWKIKDLPPLDDKVPGKAEIIAGLIFSVIAIIALNLFIDWIGIYTFNNGTYSFTPILTGQIKSLLPMFSVRIAIGAVVMLPFVAGQEAVRFGTRNYYYQISQMGLTTFDIGIVILLLNRGIDAFFITEAFKIAGIEELSSMAGKIYTGVLLLLLGLSLFSLIKRTLVILPKGRV